MSTTFFYNKNGGLSSIRSSSSIGGVKNENSSYYGSGKSGMTFRTGTMTTRLNGTGRSIGSGTGFGTKQYYSGRSFSTSIPKIY